VTNECRKQQTPKIIKQKKKEKQKYSNAFAKVVFEALGQAITKCSNMWNQL